MRNIAPRDASETRGDRTAGMARIARLRRPAGRPRPRPAAAGVPPASRPDGRRGAAVHGGHALRQHPASRRRDAAARAARRSSGASRASCAGTRWRWSCAPTGCRTASAATSRPTPRRRRCTRSASIISSAARSNDGDGDLIYFQGHASPGIYARAFLEGRLSVEKLHNFRQELRRGRRPVVVSASVADAGLLAVPDGLDGPRPDHVDLPGALQPLPRGSRAARSRRTRRSGRSSATARPTSRSRSARSAWRRARSSTT